MAKRYAKKVDTPVEDPDDLTAELVSEVGGKLEKQGMSMTTARQSLDDINSASNVTEWIPTNIWELDFLLSKGKGMPVGRAIEMFGGEGAGKTALTHFLVQQYQQYGAQTALFDYEQALDEDHYKCYDIDLNRLLLPDLETLEDGWNTVANIIGVLKSRKAKKKEDPPMLVVWDSIAQSPPRDELNEKDHESKHVGLVARAMSKGFRKHLRQITHSRMTLLFVNQIRDIIGASGFGPKTTTPGGRAVRFGCSIRLSVALVETIKNSSDKAVGHVLEVRGIKNRMSFRNYTAKIYLSYTRGIDPWYSNFLFLKRHKIATPAGKSGYKIKQVSDDAFKKSEFRDFYEEHQEEIDAIRDEIFASEVARLSKD